VRGKIRGLSEHTAEKFIPSARSKLHAGNRTHAVARAIRWPVEEITRRAERVVCAMGGIDMTRRAVWRDVSFPGRAPP
jgi:hypothetical protein